MTAYCKKYVQFFNVFSGQSAPDFVNITRQNILFKIQIFDKIAFLDSNVVESWYWDVNHEDSIFQCVRC